MSIHILAIESSCDDTGASVIKDGQILSNVVSTQIVHEQYGGVVPEVASRAHQVHIVPVVEAAMRNAHIQASDLNAIAFTAGPGLMGSLLVGTSFAKGMALAHRLPLIEVNHMTAHVLAHCIDDPKPTFPFLCLTVSGGHTQIVLVESPLQQMVLGATIDDAAGEAFDKTGKMLGLPYPAGPHLDKLAQLGKAVFPFPTPQIDGLDFSFSGLKTSILYFLQKEMQKDPSFIESHMNDICASVQSTIIRILLLKLKKAVEQTGITQVGVAGGVSANSGLRKGLSELGQQEGWSTFIPKFEYCTDNAAMIAMTAHFMYEAGQFTDQSVVPYTRNQ